MRNLYKVVTSYDGSQNFASYYVAAENGMIAGAIVNTRIFNKRAKKHQEVVEEIKFVGQIEIEQALQK